jgi:hypothetical protein
MNGSQCQRILSLCVLKVILGRCADLREALRLYAVAQFADVR